MDPVERFAQEHGSLMLRLPSGWRELAKRGDWAGVAAVLRVHADRQADPSARAALHVLADRIEAGQER